MKVTFTGSWYDEKGEKDAANSLMAEGCVLISQHADSMGAPTACEEAGVPNISYNCSNSANCPNTFIVASKINWTPYFEYIINSVMNNEKIDYDWIGTIANDAVQLTEVNERAAAKGTQKAIDEAIKKLNDGTLHVYDTSSFTVEGKPLTTYMADVDTDENFTPDTEAVSDGYFHESEYRSAPYFNINIDGITLLDTAY
jgi:basic membrane protein A